MFRLLHVSGALLLYILPVAAQKTVLLSGTIKQGRTAMPIDLNINIKADTITGICTTGFPIGRQHNTSIGTEPASGLRTFEMGILNLAIGDFTYRKVTAPLTGYEITDGFRLDLIKNAGTWTGQFVEMENGRMVRHGPVSFSEKKQMIQAVKQQPKKIRPASRPLPLKAIAPKPDTAKSLPRITPPIDTFSRYQPLYRFGTTGIRFSVQDAYKEDGDVISWQLDDNAPQRLTLSNTAQAFSLQLSAGKLHTLTITLLNEGGEYGNTPAIDLSDGHTNFHRDISGDYGQVYRLYLLALP